MKSLSPRTKTESLEIQITVTDIENEDPYLNWISMFYPGKPDPEITGMSADPDGDGLSNKFEYVYESDPTRGLEIDKQAIISVDILTGAEINAIDGAAGLKNGDRYFVIRARKPKDLKGSTWDLLTGDTLLFFSSPTTRYGSQVNDGAYWIEDYFIPTPVSDADRAFARVVLDAASGQ